MYYKSLKDLEEILKGLGDSLSLLGVGMILDKTTAMINDHVTPTSDVVIGRVS